ncbi:protein KRI1 homolog [Ptychodera flava]|uniref:protein KRI1 homolog n=1 Tax=Ptychodera flava TaxID=63121 RepID=UPI00396A259F
MADEEFTINKKYAEKYNSWRRKEELQKLKDRYGDQVSLESSSSESEDEEGSAWNEQTERDFFRTLSAVKFKDPKIYQKDVTFYHDEESSSASPGDGEDNIDNKKEKKKSKKDQPMYLKDYERKILTEEDGKFEDEEDESDDDIQRNTRAASPSYFEEQQLLKDSFKAALASSDSEEDDKEDTFLTKRHKSQEELKQEEEDYIQWLKGQKDDDNDAELAEMIPLKEYWTDPNLDKGEQFLRDYILNKGYLRKSDKNRIPTYGEIVGDDDEESDEDYEEDFSEEERQLEKEEEFERKYNFRYEEPDSDFVKRYPRTVGDSVRRENTKRAAKRSEIKERKDKEKDRVKEELKQLKNIKKHEILEKIDQLKQITGNTTVGFNDEDIDGDFDPVKYDQLMQKVFDNEYYAMEAEESKPEFHDEELDQENWDAWIGDTEDHQNDYVDEPGDDDNEYADDDYANDDDGPHCEDPNFNMDADYDPSMDSGKSKKKLIQEMMAMSKKKKKRQSKFAEALKREKPVFDPSTKSFEEYFEEYYKLDYEDILNGQPCRFKYRQVVANDFGLSAEEILRAKERELNQWASLKKTCQYRSTDEEIKDVNVFKKKSQNMQKKQRVFPSLFSEESEETPKVKQKKRKLGVEESESTEADSLSSKRQKKEKSESNSEGSTKNEEKEMVTSKQRTKQDEQTKHSSKPKSKTEHKISNLRKNKHITVGEKKRKAVKMASKQGSSTKTNRKIRKRLLKPLLSNLRVKAYGINPWKLQYQTGRTGKTKNKKMKTN